MIIADRLKAIRQQKDMSQGDIEKKTGLLRCYISRVVLAELKANEVIDGIRRNILRCEGTGDSYQPFAALKGYELLGKYLKLFSEKVEYGHGNALIARLLEGRKRVAGSIDNPKCTTGNM
jgi:transcriptional regulator with XRE-family HTH domain